MNLDKCSTSMLLALVACVTLAAGDARAEGGEGEKKSKITRWTGSMPEGAAGASASASAAPAAMPASASASMSAGSGSSGASAGMSASASAMAPAAAAAPKPAAEKPAMKPAMQAAAGEVAATTTARVAKAKKGLSASYISEQDAASEALRQEQLSRINAKAGAKTP